MKSKLEKSHDAMLAFLEERIEESDKWTGGKSPSVQRNYNKAVRLVAKARAARPMSPAHRRRIAMEEGCATCAELARGSFGPYHDPSPRCESGKHPHCTCDTCF